jgi:hypothetical protein
LSFEQQLTVRSRTLLPSSRPQRSQSHIPAVIQITAVAIAHSCRHPDHSGHSRTFLPSSRSQQSQSHVLAVILSVAKDPDAPNQPQPSEPFQPDSRFSLFSSEGRRDGPPPNPIQKTHKDSADASTRHRHSDERSAIEEHPSNQQHFLRPDRQETRLGVATPFRSCLRLVPGRSFSWPAYCFLLAHRWGPRNPQKSRKSSSRRSHVPRRHYLFEAPARSRKHPCISSFVSLAEIGTSTWIRSEKNIQKVGTFSPPENHHTIHHDFTSNSPRCYHPKTTKNPPNSAKPPQKHHN